MKKQNVFLINGIKESISKTEYLTTKDEIQDVFMFNADDNANQAIISCLRSHNIHMENIRLKQEIAKKKGDDMKKHDSEYFRSITYSNDTETVFADVTRQPKGMEYGQGING